MCILYIYTHIYIYVYRVICYLISVFRFDMSQGSHMSQGDVENAMKQMINDVSTALGGVAMYGSLW